MNQPRRSVGGTASASAWRVLVCGLSAAAWAVSVSAVVVALVHGARIHEIASPRLDASYVAAVTGESSGKSEPGCPTRQIGSYVLSKPCRVGRLLSKNIVTDWQDHPTPQPSPSSTSSAGQTLADYLRRWGVPAAIIAGIVFVIALKPLLDILKSVFALLRDLLTLLSPSLYTRAGREDLAVRRRTAQLLLERLNSLEEDLRWQTSSITDIRATVESTDMSALPHGSRRWPQTNRLTGTYQTRSVRQALLHHSGHLILLQGPPGAGKSVALRELARQILLRAVRRRQRRIPVLALYVNLRDLRSNPDEVTADTFIDYIKKQVNPRSAPGLTKYFNEVFLDDLANGRVILFLDSFDEIPSVLGSANIDHAALPYIESITALRSGGSATCVVASRAYRGPRVPGWTKLELIGLSFEEQEALLAAYGVDKTAMPAIETLLLDPRRGFTADLRNPLYLALLASYMRTHDMPPVRPTEMFDDYVRKQLLEVSPTTEEILIQAIIEALQQLAFALTARPDAGLVGETNVLRENLVSCLPLERQADAAKLLAIARRSKLIVDVDQESSGGEMSIAFAHRRVMEYFATRHVIQHPSSVTSLTLATNKRWRETTVAMLQVGSDEDKVPLLNQISNMLHTEFDAMDVHGFEWSPTSVHVVELLVSAYVADARDLSSDIKQKASELAELAWSRGTISDRKLALDCLPILLSSVQIRFTEDAFGGNSDWLRISALRDCSTLNPLPDSIDAAIRRLITTLVGRTLLTRDALRLDADLRRLYNGRMFVRIRRALSAAPIVLLVMAMLGVTLDFTIGFTSFSAGSARGEALYGIFLPFTIFWLMLNSSPVSYASESRLSRFFNRVMKRWWGWEPESSRNAEILTMLVLLFICINVLFIAYVGIYHAVEGHVVAGLAYLIIGSIVWVYVWGWGPALLLGIQRRWLSPRVSAWEIAFIVARATPWALRRIRRTAGQLVGAVILGLLIQLLWIGLLLGVAYLLLHFAGTIGHHMVKYGGYALTFAVPAIIIITILREIMSRRRVTQMTRGQISQATLIEKLCGFKDSIEAAEYLRLVRIHRTNDLRNLPRSFIRQLSLVIEAAPDDSESRKMGGSDFPLDKLPSGLDPIIVQSLSDGSLTARRLVLWRGSVLDELGRIDELLRER